MYLDIVIQKMKRLFNISSTNNCRLRLWKKGSTNIYDLVTYSNQTLYDDCTFKKEMVMSILVNYIFIVNHPFLRSTC